jgi:Ca-activated chloride channel family protein
MLSTLRETQGETGKPVRIFPIAFGKQADADVLQRIAEATNSASYSAADPKTIDKVFTAVVSNF